MMLTLHVRSALLRSAAAFVAAAAVGPAFGQVPPGMVPAMPQGTIAAPAGDPFAGGAYAVPIGTPVAIASSGGAAAPTLSAPVTSAPLPEGAMISGPTTSGGPVYMAPQVIGGAMPGGPDCNCGPGGAPMFDPSMGGVTMGAPMMGPSYGAPFAGGGYGAPMYGAPGCGVQDDCCCLDDCCLLSWLFGCHDGGYGACPPPCAPVCDPCQPVCAPMCDPCQQSYPVCPPVCDPCQTGGVYPGAGGLYHGAGGSQRCGWATGFSWVFLKPFYGADDAFSVTNTGAGFSTTTTREFDHSMDLSPRVFVEYVGRGDNGIRATWFGFENDADEVTHTVPVGSTLLITTPLGQTAAAGSRLTAASEINLDTIDLDLTQRLQVRRSLVNVGGGVRWASFEHDYRSFIADDVLGDASGAASRNFNGIGPTVFGEWRRPLGSSRFSLLANIRGSILYGESDSELVAVDSLGFVTTNRTENDDFVAIGETQLGGEWSAWISPRTVLFVQAAWETQYWLGVGSAFDRNDDVGLFGFSTTVGLEW